MRWTNTPPAVPGWYWFRRPGSRPACVEVAPPAGPGGNEVRGQIVGCMDWYGVRHRYFAGGHWSGPIPLPEIGSPPPPQLGGTPPPATRT
jgi:hypothetical protein